MAVDEAVLIAVSEGKSPPTLRFYEWQPAALTVGYFQRALAEVNLSALHQAGIGFVRRMTGGRAVLHDRELTYSLTLPEHYPGLPTTVNEAYRVLSLGLLEGFRRIGLDAQMVRLQDNRKSTDDVRSPACFDAPSWYELVVDGRKVAGSAQTRQKGVLLQHGAILLEFDDAKLLSVLKVQDESARHTIATRLQQSAVAINPLRRANGLPPLTVEQLFDPFREGFAAGLQAELEAGELSAYELEWARTLWRDKYRTDEWNFRK